MLPIFKILCPETQVFTVVITIRQMNCVEVIFDPCRLEIIADFYVCNVRFCSNKVTTDKVQGSCMQILQREIQVGEILQIHISNFPFNTYQF